MRIAALGRPCEPLNPHAQRLQVAAHKQVRQLALPKAKGKAKAKAKGKPKAKAKGSPKKKAAAKAKTRGHRSKTPYGNAKDAYFQWLLGFNIRASTARLAGHQLSTHTLTHMLQLQAEGALREDDIWGNGVVVAKLLGTGCSASAVFR